MRFCADHGQVMSSLSITTLECTNGAPAAHVFQMCQHGMHANPFYGSDFPIEPRIRPPMHALGLLRKRVDQTGCATQALTNLLGLRDQPRGQVFPLTLIGEIVAVPTEEITSSSVENGNAPPTHAPVHDPRVDEPRALAPIATRGPSQ